MDRRIVMYVVACLVFAHALPGMATTYYVSPSGLESQDGTNWGTAVATVTNALAKSSAGDEIWVAAGTYYPGAARANSIQMKTGVALYGGFSGTETARDQRDWTNNVTILSGDIGTAGIHTDNSYHVVKGATDARLDGFRILHGRADGASTDGFGGGMYSSGVHPITANCVFSNNFAGAVNTGGGAIYWSQGAYNTATTLWYNCTFECNEAFMPANYTYGSAIYLTILTNIVGGISNCIFRDNQNTGTYGSATVYLSDIGVKIWPAGAAMSVADCLFQSNSNKFVGALTVNGFKAPIVLSNCRFSTNASAGDQCSGGLTISVDSAGQGVRAQGCVFYGNIGYDGGAVQVATGGTNSWWEGCVFVSNTALHAGGALAGLDGVMTNCSFTDNRARYWGGAFWLTSAAPGSTTNKLITNCSFTRNSDYEPGYDGGAIQASYRYTCLNSTFTSNTATAFGGAVSRQAACTISNCTFVGNSTAGAGGAVNNLTGDSGVSDCTFIANRCGDRGGAWYEGAGAGATGTISYCKFFNNISTRGDQYAGGAIYVQTVGSPKIRYCVFDGNRATNVATTGGGGAIFCYTVTTALVENCVFRGNLANSGAIFLDSGASTLSNCTFYANTSTVAGIGAVYKYGAGTSSVVNCVLWTNVPKQISTGLAGSAVTSAYSCVQGGFVGVGNQSNDPLFVDSTYLHEQSPVANYTGGYFSRGAWSMSATFSPVIDKGDPDSPFDQEPSPNGERINMGAYGNTPTASSSLPAGTIFWVR